MSDKIAIMYDFDETLCTRNMQEYSLLPHLNLNPDEFWGSVVNLARTSNMDPTLAYMYLMIEEAKKRNYPIKREEFQKLGADIEYYPGVEDYFHKINEYGKSLGMQIQHFIISSGTKEIIEGCSIYDQFTKVFASEFHYDENGDADWPALAINYTGKTQFLFRINKNISGQQFMLPVHILTLIPGVLNLFRRDRLAVINLLHCMSYEITLLCFAKQAVCVHRPLPLWTKLRHSEPIPRFALPQIQQPGK